MIVWDKFTSYIIDLKAMVNNNLIANKYNWKNLNTNVSIKAFYNALTIFKKIENHQYQRI